MTTYEVLESRLAALATFALGWPGPVVTLTAGQFQMSDADAALYEAELTRAILAKRIRRVVA